MQTPEAAPSDTPSPPPGRPWAVPASWTLALINVAVLLFQVRAGVFATTITASGEELLRWGAVHGPTVFLEGEVWRLLTAAFVHVGVWHLALNLWALWALGPVWERRLGTATFLAVYLLSALAGSLFAMWDSPLSAGAGASGALFGLTGVELAALLRRADPLSARERRKRLWRSVLFLLSSESVLAATDLVSTAAHVGGLLAGGAFGLWVMQRPEAVPRSGRARVAVLCAMSFMTVLLGGAVASSVRENPTIRSHWALTAAYDALQAQRPQQALGFANEAVATGVELGQAFRMRAHVHEVLGQAQEAIADYSALMATDSEAVFARARRCYLRGYVDPAPEMVRECEQASRDAEGETARVAHLGLTRGLLANARFTEALLAAERALSLFPGDAEARVMHAQALLDLGRLDDAGAAFQDVLSVTDGKLRRDVLMGQAMIAARQGDSQRARDILDALVRDGPEDAEVLAQRALRLYRDGELDAAIADLDRASALAPQWPLAHNNRAWYLLVAGRAGDALAPADRAVALAPDQPYVRGTRCWVREALGDVAGALEDCRAAVLVDPEEPINAGMVALLEGAPLPKVEEAWARAAKSNPAYRPLFERTLARHRQQRATGASVQR